MGILSCLLVAALLSGASVTAEQGHAAYSHSDAGEVRQSFVLNGQVYTLLVPKNTPGHTVQPYVHPVCANFTLSEDDCSALVVSTQDVYDVAMGFHHGFSEAGMRATASKYTNSSFWRTICPGLHVNSAWPSDMWTATTANEEETLNGVEEAMKLNGYFKLDGGDWKLPVTHGTLAQCVVNLREQGLPGVFGYMFDEFWMLTRRLHSIVRRILGSDALVMPDIWVFNINPRTAEPKGWAPHRDRPYADPLRPDGSAASINFWLPLTEATPLNGCMYMLPKQFDPTQPGEEASEFRDVPKKDQLQFVRALPAQPGEILGWDGWVLHWGSAAVTHPPQPARISVAVEFQMNPYTTGQTPMNSPLMALDFNPSTHVRLAMVCKQVRNYKHIREQLLPWVERVCDRMNDIGKAAGVPSIPGSHDELIVLQSEQDLVDWAAKQQ